MNGQFKDIKHYEWYLGNGRFLQGEEVLDYLMPRYRKAMRLYRFLLAQLRMFYPTGNLVNDYLDLKELLSLIGVQIEVFEDKEERI